MILIGRESVPQLNSDRIGLPGSFPKAEKFNEKAEAARRQYISGQGVGGGAGGLITGVFI